MAIQIGDVVGDYRVTGILGRGGMGQVFRVHNLLTDRDEAMKVVLPDLDANPGVADRFLREIKVHASLHHPHIAALRTAQRIGDRLLMIVELVDGVSLEEMLRQGPMDVSLSVRYTQQVLAALGYAHQRGVIHRDIKPANILITRSGDVKLTDFGIARSLSATRLTGAGLAIGTIAYMSPEQIQSSEVDGRSDIYSLGLTSYEMLTGRRAIQGDTPQALMQAQFYSTPPAPSALNSAVPPPISAAILRALAKDPGRRFQTAAEFSAALDCDMPNEKASGIPVTATIVQQTGTAGATFDRSTLDRLTTALAPHLGPIAKVLVNRSARTSRTLGELQDTLAAEISSTEDRKRFLATVRSLP